MKIFKDAIITHASTGRITLQIPDRCYGVDPNQEHEDAPDEWFIRLKDHRPASNRENGYLFLTRRGYEANKERLKVSFGSVQSRGTTWEAFEQDAERHFKEVEKKTLKYIDLLKNKIQSAQDDLEKMLKLK